MKCKHIVILYLVIFLIAEAIFFINILEPSVQVIFATLFAAALVSLVIGTIMLAAIYLVRKLSAGKE